MQAQASCDLGYIADAYFQVTAQIPETAGVVVGKGLAGELQPLGFAQRIFALFWMHGLLFRGYARETAILDCTLQDSFGQGVLTCATKKDKR